MESRKGQKLYFGTVYLTGKLKLACQVLNNQPTVVRFNAKRYAKAKELMEAKGLHVVDALKRGAKSHNGLP